MKNWKPQRYQSRLYATFILLWIIPILMLTVYDCVYVYRTTLSQIEKYTRSNLQIAAQLLDSDLASFTGIVSSIARNEEVAEIVGKDSIGTQNAFEETQRLYVITQISMAGLPENVPIHIVNRNRMSRFSTTDYYLPYYVDEKSDFYQDMVEASERLESVQKVHWRVDSGNMQDICYVVGQAIETPQQTIAGYVILDVYKSYFKNIFTTIAAHERSNLVVLDRRGFVIADLNDEFYTGLRFDTQTAITDWEENGIFELSLNGIAHRVYYETAPVSQMKVVELIPNSYFVSATLRNVRVHFIIYFSLLLIGMALIRRNVRFISSPVNELVGAMNEVKRGNYSARVDLQGDAEIEHLGDCFNDMTLQIEQLIDENTIQQQLLHEAELKALRAQITPHFLYNCLNSIYMMARIGKMQEVQLMAKALSKYYRNRVRTEDGYITVQEEIAQIDNYLQIHKLRYADKLEYSVQMSADVSERKIMKLMLQPLVENAVVHGIEQKDGPGKILVTAESCESGILLRVLDDGKGFGSSKAKGESVGLENIRQRLTYTYGKNYRMTIMREEPYTIVEIWIGV